MVHECSPFGEIPWSFWSLDVLWMFSVDLSKYLHFVISCVLEALHPTAKAMHDSGQAAGDRG